MRTILPGKNYWHCGSMRVTVLNFQTFYASVKSHCSEYTSFICVLFQENHVINVCCVTNRGRSDPGHCMTTMSSRISKIEGLSCEHVTPDFVRVFWRPLDSSFAYKISIGEVNGETERYLVDGDLFLL